MINRYMHWVGFLLFIGVAVSAETLRPLNLVDTIVIDSSQIQERMDLSGLATDGKDLFTVSDLSHLNDIYKIVLEGPGKARLSVHQKFDTNWLEAYLHEHKSQGRFDLEGLALCGQRLILINESTRSLISMSPSGRARSILLPFREFHEASPYRVNPFSGVVNAGLEAVACDWDNKKIYIFNERQFRMAYTYDWEKKVIEEQFTFAAGDELPAKFGRLWMYPDFAGAHFHKGFLYLLVRNRRLIVKYDLKTHRVIERYTFAEHTKDLFNEKGVFGLAEGVTIIGNEFYVVLDHNKWTHKGTKSQKPILLRLRAEGLEL